MEDVYVTTHLPETLKLETGDLLGWRPLRFLVACGVRLAALAPEYRKGMVKRGNIEDTIEVSARQHFVNERTRVHDFQMFIVRFGPPMQ